MHDPTTTPSRPQERSPESLPLSRVHRSAGARALLLCLSVLMGMGTLPSSPDARAADAPPREEGPFRSPELVELVTLDPSIRLDVRYATEHNFTGERLYPQARVFLQRPAADALVRVHRSLAVKGYGLLVFDGYRPWSITRTMWQRTAPGKRSFVADPAKGSKHNRGCAVDVSLFDRKTGREVPMPSAYDAFTERAHPTYEGGTVDARRARDLLRDAMEREGFFVYPWEWWHFDYKDWREYPILDVAFPAIEREAAHPAPADMTTSKIVDLTHAFDASTLYWPTSPSAFQLDPLSFGQTPGGWFYAANTFCAPEHGGTHLDAPIHFAREGWTADRIPVDRLAVPAYLLDMETKAAADRDAVLSVEDVRRWEASHGKVPPGSIVLLRTGWGRRYPDRKAYFGDDTPGEASKLHFPSFGRDAAELLVRERGVYGLGVDSPSIDPGASKEFPVHRITAAANVFGLENLANLPDVPEAGAWIVVLPMKIGGGSGGPLRAIVIIPRP